MSTTSYAQNREASKSPKLILGITSVLNSSSNILGINYSSHHSIDNGSAGKKESIFSLNLSPKIGFCISHESVLGFDLHLANFKNEETKLSLIGIGPFYRYYPNAFNKTFIELNSALGRVDENPNYLFSNNKQTNIYKSIGFSVGTGMVISKKFALEISVNYKHENLIEDSNNKEVYNSLGISLGFIGFL